MAQVVKCLVFIVWSLLFLQLAFSRNQQFDFFKHSVTWIPSYCNVTDCRILPISEKFNLHGLWPLNYIGSKRELFPKYCKDVKYRPVEEHQDLFVRMSIYWANLKDGRLHNVQTWHHAFRKHGTCCLIWYDQYEYFTLGLRLFDMFDFLAHLSEKGVVPANDHTYSVERIRRGIIELTTKEPDLFCNTNTNGQKQLLEIRICYSPGGEVIDCRPETLAHTCSDPQVLFPAKPVPPN